MVGREENRDVLSETASGRLVRKALRAARWRVRDAFPKRWVVHELGGVRMSMPWSHRLPDYMNADPAYGENLLVLAELLAADGPLQMLDVGANIGDSTLLVLARIEGRVLAVEPDEVFLPFLRHNVAGDDRVVVEESLLIAEQVSDRWRSVRVGGTATFVRDDDGGSEVPSVTADQLRARHPEFDQVRLVKSDTDGYDVALGPAIARAWADSRPVLFLEYDERLTRRAGLEPRRLWADLEDLGYCDVAVWDNGGHPLFRSSVAEMVQRVEIDYPTRDKSFWDVAVAHADDRAGRAALDALIPG